MSHSQESQCSLDSTIPANHPATSSSISRWNSVDTRWALTLFGTSFGAGSLFMPLGLGAWGIWPVIICAFLAFPMVYLAHRAYTRLSLCCSSSSGNINDVIAEHFGVTAARLFVLFYFVAVYPALVVYAPGIVNVVITYMQHQLGIADPSRVWVSFVMVALLLGVLITGRNLTLRVCQFLVMPLIVLMTLLSFYLIRYWHPEALGVIPPVGHSLDIVMTALPLVIFGFTFAPACSAFGQAYHKSEGSEQKAERKTSLIMRRTTIALVFVIMFFCFSSMMALDPAQIGPAKASNLTILSYLGLVLHDGVLGEVVPFVVFAAIASSFFGFYLGAREALEGVLLHGGRTLFPKLKAENRILQWGMNLFFFLSLWYIAAVNPNAISVISNYCGPFQAVIMCLIPVYATYRVERLKRYRGWSNAFVALVGLATVFSFIYSQL
ncbi:amino acid permease [Dongshaea marina]|uniref:amino acid permease n=1 Tax=Dongshaea marina TaxID=2047966 RepID=UPI000D3E3E84|nr:serine transporter [Dongshaea marina]